MACVLGLCPLGASVKEQVEQVVLFHLGLEQGQSGDGRRHCLVVSVPGSPAYLAFGGTICAVISWV